MKETNEITALRNNISLLQAKQAEKLQSLKTQLHLTFESLKPVNLIKNTFNDVTSSPEVKNSLVNNAIGLATGYISKKLLIGGTHNPIKKILGALVEFSVASFVAKRADTFSTNEQDIELPKEAG